MKWEQYKSMSNEHQIQYDVRFRSEKPKLTWSFRIFTSFFLVINITLLISYMYLDKATIMLGKPAQIVSFISLAMRFIAIATYLMLLDGLTYLYKIISFEIRKNKWLKERGYR